MQNKFAITNVQLYICYRAGSETCEMFKKVDKMNLGELVAKSKSDLMKITKEEIVDCITKNAWQYNQAISNSKELNKTIEENKTNEKAACIMLSAFLGDEILVEEYRSVVKTSHLNILALAGRVCAFSVKK